MKYQSLMIENFRGISSLEINDLKRINLLVGRNNCGKTSILEAIFLLSGMSNPQLAVNIHNFRNLILTNDEDFSYMFNNMNFNNLINISGYIEGKKRKLKISPIYETYKSDNNVQKEIITGQNVLNSPYTSTVQVVEGVSLDFTTHNNKNFITEIRIKESKLKLSHEYKEDLVCSYLNPVTSLNVNENQMEKLLVQKDLSKIIEVLRGVEPKINDIRMGAKGMVFVDIGEDKFYPVNIMGDGMRRILNILASLSDMKNGVLLIDEFETGLHYSSLKVAWRAFLSACEKYNVQIIATSHSYECIGALSKSYAEMDPDGDNIRLYRIDKDGMNHKAYMYNSKLIEAGIKDVIEVR